MVARVGNVNLIVNDWRAQAVGRIVSALLLREACSLPSLLHRAGTWAHLKRSNGKGTEFPAVVVYGVDFTGWAWGSDDFFAV